MSSNDIKPKIVFLNQYAGPLFRELAEDLVKEFGTADLFTGQVEEIDRDLSPELHVIPSPSQVTSSSLERIVSWLKYIAYVLPRLWQRRASPLLFIVSNPPFLPWLGFLVRLLWKQPYVVLVYDIYPEMMVRFSGLPEDGFITRLWHFLNKIAFEHSEAVFTIGACMAATLETTYDPCKTKAGKTIIIPNWADPDLIRPIEKSQNWFALQHNQFGRLTVLYSGTLGLKHNVESMLKAAINFKDSKDVHFMFIGRGEGYDLIERTIAEHELLNTTLMPLVPERDLPYSLSTGDVAVVALDRGGEGVYVPSKTYYALAAGSALLAISSQENEIAELVRTYQCGLVVPPGDVDAFVRAIYRFRDDRSFLADCRRNARQAVEQEFNRKVCTQNYASALRKLVQFS